MPDKPLVILAHPKMHESRINRALIGAFEQSGAAEIHDIHAAHPDGIIDAEAERARVDAHRRIILQFPLYWYSCPPFLSSWLVEVYTRGGALNFKTFGVVTTGSNRRDYPHDGRYQHTLDELMTPFELLARRSGMHYLPAFAVTAAGEMTDAQLGETAAHYVDHFAHCGNRFALAFAPIRTGR